MQTLLLLYNQRRIGSEGDFGVELSHGWDRDLLEVGITLCLDSSFFNFTFVFGLLVVRWGENCRSMVIFATGTVFVFVFQFCLFKYCLCSLGNDFPLFSNAQFLKVCKAKAKLFVHVT